MSEGNPNDDASHNELPFLVTNWLAHYTGASRISSGNDCDSEEGRKRVTAENQIRQAASQLAVAFSSLGAFGTIIPVRRQIFTYDVFLW
jgi:hypothetical protein